SFQRIGWSVAELRKERPQAVLIGLAQYLLQGQFFDLGNLFRDERQVEGRVLPATVGYRRQEGGVGFQQNLLDGCHPYDVANRSFQRIGWSVAELRKERPQAVLIGLAQYLLQGQFFDLGNLFRDERQVEGRVLPATVGYRRQEGGVGFQQNLLDGCHPYDVAN